MQRRPTSGTRWSTRSGSSCSRPSRSCSWPWSWRSCSTSELRGRTFWRMGVLLPNVTSVAAVGIIFTLIFARDFGLVNWLLGLVGVDPIDWQEHRWSSWLAISVDGRLALDRLQRADLPGRAAGGARRTSTRRPRIDGAVALAPVLVASRCRCCGPTIIFVSIISTIGGIQLFTEPLLFNPGANAISRRHTAPVPDADDVPRTSRPSPARSSATPPRSPGCCSWSSRSSPASTCCCCAGSGRRCDDDRTRPAGSRSPPTRVPPTTPTQVARCCTLGADPRVVCCSSPCCRRSRSTSWW